MNSVEHTALLLEQHGIQIRLVDGFSLEIRMHSLSIWYLLLLIPDAGSKIGLCFSSDAGML